MKNMKVRTKLLVSFIIEAVMVSAAGISGIFGLNTMNDNEEQMYDMVLKTNSATLLRRNIQAQRAACRGAALKLMLGMEYEYEFEALASLDTEFDTLFTYLEAELTRLENKELVASAKESYAEYISLRDPFIEAVRANNEESLTDVLKR